MRQPLHRCLACCCSREVSANHRSTVVDWQGNGCSVVSVVVDSQTWLRWGSVREGTIDVTVVIRGRAWAVVAMGHLHDGMRGTGADRLAPPGWQTETHRLGDLGCQRQSDGPAI